MTNDLTAEMQHITERLLAIRDEMLEISASLGNVTPRAQEKARVTWAEGRHPDDDLVIYLDTPDCRYVLCTLPYDDELEGVVRSFLPRAGSRHA